MRIKLAESVLQGSSFCLPRMNWLELGLELGLGDAL